MVKKVEPDRIKNGRKECTIDDVNQSDQHLNTI